jgi:hypothetical protein
MTKKFIGGLKGGYNFYEWKYVIFACKFGHILFRNKFKVLKIFFSLKIKKVIKYGSTRCTLGPNWGPRAGVWLDSTLRNPFFHPWIHTHGKNLQCRLWDVKNSGYKNSSPTEVKRTFILQNLSIIITKSLWNFCQTKSFLQNQPNLHFSFGTFSY